MAARVLKADAVVEGVLAVLLVGGAAIGKLGAGDYPSPVDASVVAAMGIVLVPVAFVLWRLAGAQHIPPRWLRSIAIANAATALLATACLLLADGFSVGGAAIVVATVVALTCLAVAQLTAARAGA